MKIVSDVRLNHQTANEVKANIQLLPLVPYCLVNTVIRAAIALLIESPGSERHRDILSLASWHGPTNVERE